jgi:hypothetical protein
MTDGDNLYEARSSFLRIIQRLRQLSQVASRMVPFSVDALAAQWRRWPPLTASESMFLNCTSNGRHTKSSALDSPFCSGL